MFGPPGSRAPYDLTPVRLVAGCTAMRQNRAITPDAGSWLSARYGAGLGFSRSKSHLIELDPDERGPGPWPSRGFSQQDLPPRRDHETRKRLMLPGVVSAPAPRAERLCGVVEAAQQPRGVEIEDLLA